MCTDILGTLYVITHLILATLQGTYCYYHYFMIEEAGEQKVSLCDLNQKGKCKVKFQTQTFGFGFHSYPVLLSVKGEEDWRPRGLSNGLNLHRNGYIYEWAKG